MNNSISLYELKKIKEKNQCNINGSKQNIAQGVWRLRGPAVSTDDLLLIFHLLERDQQTEVQKLLNIRNKYPITNYKGMWEPLLKPIKTMSREELIKKLQKFRDVWEKITTRNQDLTDERINDETSTTLRTIIKFYYSDSARLIAEDWLRGRNKN